MKSALYKIKSVIIGHAIADALGVPAEFKSREELDRRPVTDMIGYGTYNLPAGCWSDDTSMALAALDSLSTGNVDWDDIMNNFCQWVYHDKYTPTGFLFDIGITCRDAIRNYAEQRIPALDCGPSDEYSNGNGSLMRIHPFALYQYYRNDRDIELIHQASKLTHGHIRSQIACGIYTFILWELLESPSKESIRHGLEKAYSYYKSTNENKVFMRLYKNIGGIGRSAEENILTREDIKSGGYAVHTLEAAVWCLLTTDSYRECVLKAVNLGLDTDTTAAVAGGLAGALYGLNSIPADWLHKLKKIESIESLCERISIVFQTLPIDDK